MVAGIPQADDEGGTGLGLLDGGDDQISVLLLVPAPHVAGVVAGKGLGEAFAKAGFQVFPHGSQILGKTLRPNLEAPLTDSRGGFLAGDSDKDRQG